MYETDQKDLPSALFHVGVMRQTAGEVTGQQINNTHTQMQPPSTQRKLNGLSYRAGGCRVNAAHRRHPVTPSPPPPQPGI